MWVITTGAAFKGRRTCTGARKVNHATVFGALGTSRRLYCLLDSRILSPVFSETVAYIRMRDSLAELARERRVSWTAVVNSSRPRDESVILWAYRPDPMGTRVHLSASVASR
jgi:hypothetical protein